MPPAWRHPGPRRSFSLTEAVVASLIVGVLMVSALQTAGAAVSARRSHALMRQGDLLARALIDEIVQCRYAASEDAEKTANGGKSTEVSSTSRAGWSTVDDYHGLVESPPRLKDGTPIPGATGWRRHVTVERVQPSTLAVVGGPSDTGLKRITVTARSPGGVETTMVALRSRDGMHDVPISPGASHVTWAGVTIAVGEDGGAVSSGTALLNRPAP